MAITLEQINDALAVREKTEVEASHLQEALDYALGVFGISYDILNADEPDDRLILGIALLAKEAPFAMTATTALLSEEKALEGVGSTKKTYAEAPTETYPVIAGILAPYMGRRGSSGISFGVSTR